MRSSKHYGPAGSLRMMSSESCGSECDRSLGVVGQEGSNVPRSPSANLSLVTCSLESNSDLECFG